MYAIHGVYRKEAEDDYEKNCISNTVSFCTSTVRRFLSGRFGSAGNDSCSWTGILNDLYTQKNDDEQTVYVQVPSPFAAKVPAADRYQDNSGTIRSGYRNDFVLARSHKFFFSAVAKISRYI